MSRLNEALELAGRGFYVFPCIPNGKTPAIKDFPSRATRDTGQITSWFASNDFNIGVSTSSFGAKEALIVVDVDNKNGKDGDAQVLSLELEGFELPKSFEQSTPTGGRHIIYVTPEACKQGVNVLGDGLDIRSRGGYIVGPGSTIDGKHYQQINGHSDLSPAPSWLVTRLGTQPEREPAQAKTLEGIDPNRAVNRAIEFLKSAPPSVENEGGDINTFKIAAKLKDLGCDRQQTIDLLMEHWNPQCSPAWGLEDLTTKVNNAFGYGREPQGVNAPEAVFTALTKQPDTPAKEHPYGEMNHEFAFVKTGAFILQETTDHRGNFTTQHLGMLEFHGWFSNRQITVGKKTSAISQAWMEWTGRRQFEGVVFSPQKDMGARWYNLWRGFTVKPAATGSHPAVDQFLEHALLNMSGGDPTLQTWLIGYFAHMIQRPFEKPLVALAFKGAKGTGKNALVERIGYLFGTHFLIADDERYLLSNFNSHLEANLFFVLDEASWAGDKRGEGKLKGLITGGQHMIERKGKEPYRVDNLTRVCIIGNEKWVVPATEDERRFAVFNVGDGRRQDRDFFLSMRLGMERGGYSHLLRYLMDFDLSVMDVNAAPATQGLLDQKHASLEPVQEWWFDCVATDSLVNSEWEGAIPHTVPTSRMRSSFEAWAQGRNIRCRLPGRNDFIKAIADMAPSMHRKKTRTAEACDSTYAYHNPGIALLRSDWDTYIGGPSVWAD